jgi:hypothetical protein
MVRFPRTASRRHHRPAGPPCGLQWCKVTPTADRPNLAGPSELSQRGIRANSISPGGIVTGIFAKTAGVSGADADRVLGVLAERFKVLQPIPRAGATDDIANAAVFLASDASTFITGQDLAVCGGLVPFGTTGWNEAVALRQELAGLVRAELAKGAS